MLAVSVAAEFCYGCVLGEIHYGSMAVSVVVDVCPVHRNNWKTKVLKLSCHV